VLASPGPTTHANVDKFDGATDGWLRFWYKDVTLAWESRGGSRYYYSRSKWTDGRSVKRYLGRGALGELAEYFDELDRQREVAHSEALRVELARLERPEAAMRALDVACRLLIEATLWANSYHRPSYHWRRRRARSAP
jgi:hypothetical protein